MTPGRAAVRRLLRPILVPGRGAGRMLHYPIRAGLSRELERSGAIRLVTPTNGPPTVSPAVLEVAERVSRAYQVARAEEPEGASPQGLWDSLITREYAPLADALSSASVEPLAVVLESMFATSTTAGLSMGGELEWLSTTRGRAFFLRWWIDGALSLAAYFGAVGEEMESGDSTIRTTVAFAQLLERLAGGLGIDLSFPRICNAWGVEFGGRLMPRSGWRHLHSAHVLATLTDDHAAPRIAEVGGGFGGVMYWLHLLRPGARIDLYDFPIVNVLAGYFLVRAGIPTRLLGESGSEAAISVLPHWRIFDEPDGSVDVVFNQDSLPEMPRDAAVRYLQTFDRIARIGFYSENHESAAPWRRGDPASAQLRLPELESHLQRLQRVYRHRAWMRRGYFEAIYRVRQPRNEADGPGHEADRR